METFGAPGLDLRHFLYVQWLILTPRGWKDIILCQKICPPSAVRQSGGFSHGLTSQADLDQKRGAGLFNTAAYQCPSVALKSESAGRGLEYWWCLWHLGTSDRAAQWSWKRISNTVQMQVNTIPFFLHMVDEIWFFFYTSHSFVLTLNNFGSYFCSLRQPSLTEQL